jgi:predicted nucleic-acid-binding protein
LIVVDTNIVVRFAVNDDADQAVMAKGLFENHTVSISRTVALETEWVLRSRYGKGRKQIAGYFDMLLAMKSVRMESESAFRKAVAWYAAGDDFADALHLANAGAAPFYTFDGEFCKNAIAGGKAPAVVNPAK